MTVPEMPEVETIRRGLNNKLCGRKIMNVDILLGRQIKWPTTEYFRAMVTGRTFCGASRIGKYLLLPLDDGSEIVFHLRMTGHIVFHEQPQEDKYARIRFLLDGNATLVYGDSRTLGCVWGLKRGERHRIKGLAEMGAEPLSDAFTVSYLQNVCAKRKLKIKQLILEQKAIGGIGNIYADEALFAAKINPLTVADALTGAELTRLHDAINKVIADGINDGGTTFRDYQNADGGQGHHAENLFVYGRAGKPCKICGAPIEKITVGGRGTHFCPVCQKSERAK